MFRRSQFIIGALAFLVIWRCATAQSSPANDLQQRPAAQESVEELAKKTQNPVSEIIKAQFQNYFDFRMGTNKITQYAQQVITTVPFKLTENWNLIARTDLPIINQPSPAPGAESAFGIGDINPTLYFSPRKSGAIKWGLGPTFTFPTATSSILGSGKWMAGPAVVVLTMQGPWVVGTRINNPWSFAGWSHQNINETWLQPFAHYNMRSGLYFASLPTITANWKTSSGNVWTVPLGGGIGKHWRLTEVWSIDAQLQSFCAVKHPDEAPNRQFFFQIQLVHPM